MKIFYKNLNDSGGVPSEIREFLNLNKNIQPITRIFSLDFFKSFVKKQDFVFVGIFNFQLLLGLCLSKIFKNKISIWSIGQIANYSIDKRLFPKSPIIGEFSAKKVIDKKIRYKKLFLFFLNKLISKKTIFWCFSTFEEKEISSIINNASVFKRVYWPVGSQLKTFIPFKKSIKQRFGFQAKRYFLCYSRIDVKVKGIDRFLELAFSTYFSPEDYFIVAGPVYNSKFVKETEERLVVLKDKNEFEKINILDADWVVLLSRWDGFPRVLREAIKNKIPIIASKETHFHDLINRYSIGVCFHGNLSQLESDIKLFNLENSNFKGAIQEINKCLKI
tara:strand:+ start:1479 stop:2477 length:999 start_codon:yes stop_codon:yes gene_type:complete